MKSLWQCNTHSDTVHHNISQDLALHFISRTSMLLAAQWNARTESSPIRALTYIVLMCLVAKDSLETRYFNKLQTWRNAVQGFVSALWTHLHSHMLPLPPPPSLSLLYIHVCTHTLPLSLTTDTTTAINAYFVDGLCTSDFKRPPFVTTALNSSFSRTLLPVNKHRRMVISSKSALLSLTWWIVTACWGVTSFTIWIDIGFTETIAVCVWEKGDKHTCTNKTDTSMLGG